MEMERLAKAESRIEDIEEDIKVIDTRLTKHGEQIDGLAKKTEELARDIIIIRKDVESIDDGVKRVEKQVNKTNDKLDTLVEQRNKDHLESPLDNYKKISWQVIALFVALIATLVFNTIFPMLAK